MSRFTVVTLRDTVAKINDYLADAKALTRLETGGRNGYQAVDEYAVDESGERQGSGCIRNICCGTSRECADASWDYWNATSRRLETEKLKDAAKLVSSKYPGVASHANDVLEVGTVAWRDMRRALLLGHPILDILSTLFDMAAGHAKDYGRSIAYDYVLGDYWIKCAKNARAMLDGDFGPIDNGCAEWYFWHVTSYAGFTEEEVDNA